jgi:type VI secretion system protein ImpH
VRGALVAHPQRFEFFQAVRLLQWLAAEEAGLRPGGARREAVSFRAAQSRSFAASDVRTIRTEGEGPATRYEMDVSFLGLTGTSGVLPQHYTQFVVDQVRAHRPEFRDFLDLFNHRLVALFYRAWEKNHFPIAYERARRDGTRDDFTEALFGLVGLGDPSLRDRFDVPDEAFLYHATTFAGTRGSAVALQLVLEDYFGTRVEILQFRGQWLRLSPRDRTRMRTRREPAGRNARLGSTAMIGSRTWSVETRFRVRVGPLDYATFRRFAPGGDLMRQLAQIVRLHVGPEFDFDVQPILRRDEVPTLRLGGAPGEATRIGWNSWAACRERSRDADDAVFEDDGAPSTPRP